MKKIFALLAFATIVLASCKSKEQTTSRTVDQDKANFEKTFDKQ